MHYLFICATFILPNRGTAVCIAGDLELCNILWLRVILYSIHLLDENCHHNYCSMFNWSLKRSKYFLDYFMNIFVVLLNVTLCMVNCTFDVRVLKCVAHISSLKRQGRLTIEWTEMQGPTLRGHLF